MDKAISTNRYLGPDFHPIVDPEVAYLSNPTKKQENTPETSPNQLLESRLNIKESLVRMGFTQLDFIDTLSPEEISSLERKTALLQQNQSAPTQPSIEVKQREILDTLDTVIREERKNDPLKQEVLTNLTETLENSRMKPDEAEAYVNKYFADRDLDLFVERETDTYVPGFTLKDILMSGDSDKIREAFVQLNDQIKERLKNSFTEKSSLEVTVVRNVENDDASTQLVETQVVELYSVIAEASKFLESKGFRSANPFDLILRKLTTFVSVMDRLDVIVPKTPKEWLSELQEATRKIPDAIQEIKEISSTYFPGQYRDEFIDTFRGKILEATEELEKGIQSYSITIDSASNTETSPAREFVEKFPDLPESAYKSFEMFLKLRMYKQLWDASHNRLRERIQKAVKTEMVQHTALFQPDQELKDTLDFLQKRYTEAEEVKRAEEIRLKNIEVLKSLNERNKALIKAGAELDSDNIDLSKLKEEPTDSEEVLEAKQAINSRIDLINQIKMLKAEVKKLSPEPSVARNTVPETPTLQTTTQVTQVANTLEGSLESISTKLVPIPLIEEGQSFFLERNGKKGLEFKRSSTNLNQFTASKLESASMATIYDMFDLERTNENLQLKKDSSMEMQEGKFMMVTGISDTAIYCGYLVVNNKPFLFSIPDQTTSDAFLKLASKYSKDRDRFISTLKASFENLLANAA